ncbi:aminoacyl tRNA synthase complex-interacting multifunctional protein 1 isoform X2 [Euwallacea similis]
MSEAPSIEKIKRNAQEAKDTITSLKNELHFINKEYNNILVRQLKEENAKLLIAVEEAKKKIVQLEVSNGVKQIPLPHNIQLATAVKEPIIPTQHPKEQSSAESKPKNEKKPKAPKQAPTELPIDIGRLDLRIGKVVDVRRHPDADSLYVLTIECGEDKPRTVCSGLVKHVPLDQLQDRVVMVLCNLKPVKMRGITSEAMVMCASSEQGVEVLIPPPNSQSGELVHCDGYTRQPDAVMNPKKKIFETVAPDLHTNANLEACYKGVPFSLPGKGTFHSKTLKNVPVK